MFCYQRKNKPLKRKLKNVLKPNWLPKCFVIREKILSWKELKKNGNMTLFITPKGHRVIRVQWPTIWPKGHGDICGRFNLVYDPKGLRVIRGRRDLLYDPKCHGDLCGRFYLIYDPKRSQGHLRSPWPTLWPKRSRCPLWSVWPSFWPQKVTPSLEVAVTYLWSQRSRWPLWSVWPSFWPKKVTRSLEIAVTFFMTPKVKVTFEVCLT